MRGFTHDGVGTPASTWAACAEWDRVPRVGLEGFDRLVVLAAHPDDETLGAGGLVATAAEAGLEVDLVVCTAGEHSHPQSPSHTPAVLAMRRKGEVRSAVSELAPRAALTMLSFEDGRLDNGESELVDLLVPLLGDGRSTLLVAPWRQDGHPDHEAAGRAASVVARRTGATLWEYPIWWWHWATPADAPWADLCRLDLHASAVERRRRAMLHHHTQTEPLSDAPGDEALLQPGFLEHFAGTHERFILRPTEDNALDLLHRERPDPWGVDERWYEQRKRAVTLAALPRPRFARALEIGCSTGALAEELSPRCDELVAVDASPTAADAARRRLATAVEVLTRRVPREWPPGEFDLVVISEVGYFLSPSELDGLVERVRGSLAPDGVVLLCHWRHPVRGWPQDAAAVHRTFERAGIRPVQARHTERHFEVLVLCSDATMPGVCG